jgi:DUF917 family protein
MAEYLVIQLDANQRTPESTTRKAGDMNTSTLTAECSRICQLITPAVLRALAVALLCLCVGQPVQAQGFFEKAQKATRAIQEGVQRTGEKADSALSKAGQTADAVECLASDTNCVEKANAEGQPPVAADSSGRAFPSSAGSAMVPGQCDNVLRAPPDSSGS